MATAIDTTIRPSLCNVLKSLSRDVTLLKDENRSVRRKSLEKIKQVACGDELSSCDSEFQAAAKQLYRPLLHVLSDPVERCRELAADILLKFVHQSDKPDEFLSYLIPVFVGRLGAADILEPSEEIRLLLVQILNVTIQKSEQDVKPYLSDIVTILVRTIGDNYHEVKKESCSCVVNLSIAIPECFHLQAESLITPLIQSLSHQHSKVRCASIEAIGVTVDCVSNDVINKVVSHLAQRLFDQSSLVRLATTKVTGNWLCNHKDRYSYFHKFLPLHLSSLSDDITEIKDISWDLWTQAGEKYLRENEEQIKDKIDFPKPPPDHYPPGVSRPSFGCRYLAQRHLHQIMPAILNDMEDWVEATRVKALALLYQFLLHAEEKASRYLDKVVISLSRAALDDEKQVVKQAEECAELLGYFIRPDIWCELFLPIISLSPTAGHLLILSGMLKKSNKVEMVDFVSKVAVILSQPTVCYTHKLLEQYNLVKCVEGLLNACGDLCQQSGFEIFVILISIASISSGKDTALKEKIDMCMQSLTKTCTDELGKKSLYELHFERLFDMLYESHDVWELLSPETSIFSSLILNGGSALVDKLEIVVPVFVSNLKPSRDPQLRLKFFMLLSKILLSAEENINMKSKLSSCISIIFPEILLPNLVWHAGRTAEALRTAAVSCVWAIAKACDLSVELLWPISKQLITQSITLLEDESTKTRLMTCRVLSLMLPTLTPSAEKDQLSTLLTTLAQRMEDVSDEVRIAVTETLEVYFASHPKGCQNREVLQLLYKSLVVHMDDKELRIQQAVQDLLKNIGLLAPDLLLNELSDVRSKHKETERCDELIGHLKDFQL